MMNPTCLRIAVVGNSGSGKSTLVQRVGAECSLPVKHLDQIFWASGWKLADDEAFNLAHENWLAEKHWIIDGVGTWKSLERRFDAANVIVFVDTPRQLCHARARQRRDDEQEYANPYIAAGCRYADVTKRQEEVIEMFEQMLRPKLMSLLAHYSASKATLVVDGSRPALDVAAQLRAEINTISDGIASHPSRRPAPEQHRGR